MSVSFVTAAYFYWSDNEGYSQAEENEKSNFLSTFNELPRKPFQPLLHPLSQQDRARLDMEPPIASMCNTVQAKCLVHFQDGHASGDILFVGHDQEDRMAEFVIIVHPVQIVSGLCDPVAVIRIDDKDDAVHILVVVVPHLADAPRATDVPHIEGQVLVGDALDVETDRGDRGDDLAELELVEEGGLAGGVQA